MTYRSSSPDATIARGTAIAAVVSTLLAMPIMLFWMLLLSFASNPEPIEGLDLFNTVLLLPLLLSFSFAGVTVWPASLTSAALLTFLVAMTLSRSDRGSPRKPLPIWLISGASIGILIAFAMPLESSIASKLGGSQPVLTLAGLLTGTITMLICRRLVRQFAG